MPANRPDFDAEARELWVECAGGLLPLSDLYTHEHIAAALAAAYQAGREAAFLDSKLIVAAMWDEGLSAIRAEFQLRSTPAKEPTNG